VAEKRGSFFKRETFSSYTESDFKVGEAFFTESGSENRNGRPLGVCREGMEEQESVKRSLNIWIDSGPVRDSIEGF